MIFKAMTTVMIIAACTLLPGTSPGQAAIGRTAFLNLEKVFSDFHKTQAADAQLKRQAEEFNEERRTMVAELQALDEEHTAVREEADNEALAPEVREARQADAEEKLTELRAKEDQIRSFDELRTKQLEDQGRRMRRNIVEEVRTRISEYSRDQGYAAVIDSSGQSLNGVTNVLYFDPRHDITEEVIQVLNR
jgi:Skp family chaperone for outer membrane proteins